MRERRTISGQSPLCSPRWSQYARQYDFTHDADRWKPLLGLAVVSRRDDNDKIKVGHDIKPLAAIAGAANPMLKPYRSGREKFHVAEVPLISVALEFIDADARHEAFGKPLRRDDLTAVGHSIVEY